MNSQSRQNPLILASSSKYRQALLKQLGLPFSCHSPDIAESQLPGEAAEDLVVRLARDKAATVAREHPDAVVIGSDQAGELEGAIIGKPGNEQNAVAQLMQFSGKTIHFYTAVAVHCHSIGFQRVDQIPTAVSFRQLNEHEIRRYVALDQPFDCAGSFKSERAGSALFESVRSTDPTALIGLPLITVARMLREAGLRVP